MFYLGLKDKNGKVGVIDVFDFESSKDAYIAYANRLHASVIFASFPDKESRDIYTSSFLDCDVIELVAVDDSIHEGLIMSARDFVDKYSILVTDKHAKEAARKKDKEVK